MLWAIAYLLALHGQRVLAGSGIPVLPGLLLAACPAIDVTASLFQWRRGLGRAGLRTGVVIDGLAIIGLLVATLGLHARSVLIVFGAWARSPGCCSSFTRGAPTGPAGSSCR